MPASTLIELTDEERELFHRRCRSGKTITSTKVCLSIILLADEGLTISEIADHVALSAHAIGRWRKRFVEGGIEAIEKNKPRGLTRNPSRNAEYAKLRERIIKVTTCEKQKVKHIGVHVHWQRNWGLTINLYHAFGMTMD